MGWCIFFIILGFFIMISAISNLSVPFMFVGLGVWLVATVIAGLILENKKNQKKNLPKKENIRPTSQPIKKTYPKYICNNKTLVFHRPNCSYIRGIDLESICYSDDYTAYDSDFKYSRLVEIGYIPCKRCQPR